MRRLLGLLLLSTIACSLTSVDQNDLAVRLGTRLNAAIEAQTQAANLWDKLLFGEPVNCQQQLTVPLPFVMTTTDTEQYPQAVPVVDHLNEALRILQQVVALWDWECQQGREVVPLAVVRQAEDDLRLSQEALKKATNAWYVWQP